MKLIPLTQGMFAQVDDADFDWLNQWKWYAHNNMGRGWYAVKSGGTGKAQIRMHRLLLGVTDRTKQVDHKDGNGLNNQRSNLRLATAKQNSHNRKPEFNSVSKYIGVCRAQHNRWQAYIGCNGKQTHIGFFVNELDAAIARDNKAIALFGEFAKLNFPDRLSNAATQNKNQ